MEEISQIKNENSIINHSHTQKTSYLTYIKLFMIIGIISILIATAAILYRFITIEKLPPPEDISTRAGIIKQDQKLKAAEFSTTPNNDPARMVYMSGNLTDIYYYDFNTKETIDIANLLAETDRRTITLGTWSANGDYFPFISTRVDEEESIVSTIYFYDKKNKQLQRGLDSKQDETVLFGESGFGEFGSDGIWIDESTITYYTFDKCNILDISGITNSYNKEQCLWYFKTPSLENHFRLNEKRYLVYNDQQLSFYHDIDIRGVLNEKLVGIVIDKKTGKAKYLRIYNLDNGEQVKEINIASDWHFLTAQLVPHSSNIILHLRDKEFSHSQEKFVLIDIENSTKKDILKIKPDPNIYSPSMDTVGTFQLTANGEWLVYKEVIKQFENQSIRALNMKTKKSMTICEGNCWKYKVYNPYAMQPAIKVIKK